MAFPSGSQAAPTTSASGNNPSDSSPDMRHPQVHAVLRSTKEPDTQTFRLQHHILQLFTFLLAAFKRFTFFLWDLTLRPQAPTASRLPDAPEPHTQPLPQHKDAGDDSVTSQPQDCKEVDGDTVVPESPAQAESEEKVVVEISDSEDEEKKEVIEIIGSDDEDDETSSSDQISGERDSQGSEEEDWEEPVQEDEDVQEQQSSPANDSSIEEEQDAETPGSLASNLSGDTLVEPKFSVDIPRPKFGDECPRLKRKSDAPPRQRRPELRDDPQYIDCGYTFVDDFGWVKETPKKRNSNALRWKMVEEFSDRDNARGVVYIRKHKCYENLFKVGSAKSMEVREKGLPPCARRMAEEVHTTDAVWGFRRVEALAHRDMASRNVDVKLCIHCLAKASRGDEDEEKRVGKSWGGHREWFKGDLEDIKRCVEYWAEVVNASYDKGQFVGDVSEITNRRLLSQRRKLETVEDSAELRDGLSVSPSRCPQSPDPAESPGTNTHAAREEGEGAEVDDGCGEGEGESDESEGRGEVRSRRGGVIWQRADSSDDRPFLTLEDGAVRRGSRKRKSTGAEKTAQPAEALRPGPGAERRSPKLRKSTGAEMAQPAERPRPGTKAKRRSPRLNKSAGAEGAHPAGGLGPKAGVENAVHCQA